jgi:multisubunit Na+/H+ antiporter MnhB subunit
MIVALVVTLSFALAAFGLGRAARQMPLGVPKAARIVACASVMPLAFMAVSFAFYVDGDFAQWIASREPRAYREMAILGGVGLAAAWFGLRTRNDPVDPSTFD